jgi:hypothetical protein
MPISGAMPALSWRPDHNGPSRTPFPNPEKRKVSNSPLAPSATLTSRHFSLEIVHETSLKPTKLLQRCASPDP